MGGEAAVDPQDLAGDERRLVGREERDRAGDLLGIAEPPGEMARRVAPEPLTHRATERFLRLARDHDSWSDGVAADPAFAVRGRDVAGERDEPGLRGAVREQ